MRKHEVELSWGSRGLPYKNDQEDIAKKKPNEGVMDGYF